MAHRARFRPLTLVTLLATLGLLVLPASALAAGGGWQLELGGVWVDPDVNYDDQPDEDERAQATSSSAIGPAIFLERIINRRVSVELGFLVVEPDIDVTVTDLDTGDSLEVTSSLRFRPLMIGVNFHLTPDHRADFYLGPMFAYIDYGNLAFPVDEDVSRLSSDSDFGWGAVLGLDLGLGGSQDPSWFLSFAVRYLDTAVVLTDDELDVVTTDFNPTMLTLGVAYRF